MKQHNHYDVIIVGAGVVGLTLACALPKPLRILLIEKKPWKFFFDPLHYELRVSAINVASEFIFRQIGAWDFMQALRVSPFLAIEAWDELGSGKINFDSFSIAEPRLGHIVENNVLHKGLWEVAQRNNIDFLYTEPLHLQVDENLATLSVADHDAFTAKLIIGADGAQSWVREQAQLTIEQRPYQHHALVTTIRTTQPHQKTARQIFLKEGILAFLPLLDPNLCSIVWSASSEKIQELSQMSSNDFNAAINETSQHCLGNLEKIDTSLQFNLTMRHAKKYVAHRVALVGDAAHTIHPLAGQGVNLGIEDAAELAHIIAGAYAKKRDIGYFDTLRRYERARKVRNTLMIRMMDGFKYLFGSHNTSIVALRSMGLNATNKVTFLKNFFMSQAMGK